MSKKSRLTYAGDDRLDHCHVTTIPLRREQFDETSDPHIGSGHGGHTPAAGTWRGRSRRSAWQPREGSRGARATLGAREVSDHRETAGCKKDEKIMRL